MCKVQNLGPRTEKEIAFERKKLTFTILLNWWSFDRIVSSSSSAKNSRADKNHMLSIYFSDDAIVPFLAAGQPYWIIVHEIACHILTIAFSVLSSGP